MLPFAAGLVLLFRHWAPGATFICAALSLIGLAAIAIDYFLIPEPRAFAVWRRLPDQFFLHVKATITLTIACETRIPCRLRLIDRPPASFGHDLGITTFFFPAGVHERTVTYSVEPRRRGPVQFETVSVNAASMAGLVYRKFELRVPQTAEVFPQLPGEQEGLQSHFCLSQIESRIQHTYGPGREFAQVREYRRGDDIRSIHWKRSARAGKLIVRDYEPEKGQNVFLMIDGGRLMMASTRAMSKVDWAVSSGISLAREALSRHDSVGAMCFSNDIDAVVHPSNKKTQLSNLVRNLYAFQPSFVEPDYAQAFSWTSLNLGHRCIVVIFTDLIDAALSDELHRHIRLLKRRHRVICCALGQSELTSIGRHRATTLSDAVFSAVVRDGVDNRSRILADLKHAGVDVIDVPPDKLTGSLLSSYIKVRWQ